MKFLLVACVLVPPFFIDYLMHEVPTLPSSVLYVPDLITGGVGAVVVLRLVFGGRVGHIPLRYWFVFLTFVYVVAAGMIVNEVSADVALAGVRMYFKYIPIFLLPFAFDYSDKDLKRVCVLVAILALVQIPVTLHQRFVEFVHLGTGDVVTGTTSSSGALAVLAVVLLVSLTTLYLDALTTARKALVLSLLFLVPASLAEVKIVPIFLAVGVAGVFFVRRNRLGKGRIIGAGVGASVVLALFVFAYDALYASRDESYVDFVTSRERVLDQYMLKGMQARSFGAVRDRKDVVAPQFRYTSDPRRVGRFDSLRMPFESLLPGYGMNLAIGLGIGSTFSTFGDGGRFLFVKEAMGGGHTTLSFLIWETGVIGATIFAALFALVSMDSLKLSRVPGYTGTIGAASFGVSLVAIAELFYHNVFFLSVLGAVLFFLFGCAVARASALRRGSPSSVAADLRSPMDAAEGSRALAAAQGNGRR